MNLLLRSISMIRHFAWLVITLIGLTVALIQGLLLYRTTLPTGTGSLSITTVIVPPQQQANNQHVRQQYWQVGVRSGDESANATAMRTTIRTHLPQHVADRTTDYFWIGTYLADNSFIQVGYAVPWYDRTAHWFYCAFTASSDRGPCIIGPPDSVGAEGSWHQYTLQAEAGTRANEWNWVALIDGKPVGSIPTQVGTTGRSTPAVYVEQSAFEVQPAVNDLGPIEFQPAIEVRIGNKLFAPAVHGWPMYSAPETCPPYGIQHPASNHVVLGSGLHCPIVFLPVW